MRATALHFNGIHHDEYFRTTDGTVSQLVVVNSDSVD